MKLDKELLESVARNARLRLSPEEIHKLLPQLQEIIDVFSTLDTVDTKNAPPSFQPIPIKNVMRGDTVQPSLPQDEVFRTVKNRHGPYVKGPKTF